MAEPLVETCATCAAPVIRAIHERTLKPSVIDAETTVDGNIAVTMRPGAAEPTYRILKPAEQFGRTDLHKSHFATCPQAASWRRRSA